MFVLLEEQMNTRIQKLLIAAAAGVGLLAIGLFVGQEIAPRESASQASNPNNLPGVAINAADTGDSQTTPAYQGSPGSNLLEAYQQAYRNIAATALPVVVEVEVTKEVKQSQRSNPFRFFFGPNGPQDDDESQTQGGFGSGIIIDKKVKRVDRNQIGDNLHINAQLLRLFRKNNAREVIAKGVLLPVDKMVFRFYVKRVRLNGCTTMRSGTQSNDVR